ncbi:3-oxoacyl-ACP reductase FabG [Thiomicrorhabdus cannonii]|uniref:3-oxoacyl-ACP reductase FabG n=1 Tax=Thiomicrorhabdus cannonii TaxID=2748011 RepID=UPI0015BF8ACD|nr:3-oxoacyl-ACP reductase FabG [Thiomicrorhabdus cannonii]
MPENTPKRALITGGSGDIGAAIASQLAADGYEVIVHANRQLAKAQGVVDGLLTQGYAAQAVQFDVTHPQETQAALEALLQDGAIQVIVNNAGIHDDAVMAGMSHEQWQNVIDVSLNGFFNVTQPLLLPMIRTRWGRIINIASIAGVMGNRGQTNYAAAKAGLIGASKSLALELASRKITVNVVAPGIIAGSMTEDVFSPDTIKQMVPAQRAGTPQEVAHAVSFLASEQAAYITSQVIQVNGGMA